MADFMNRCHVVVLGAGAAKDAGYPVVTDLLSVEYINSILKDLEVAGAPKGERTRLGLISECQYLLNYGDDLESIFMQFESSGNQEGISRVLRYYFYHFNIARDRGETGEPGAEVPRCDYFRYFLRALEYRQDITAVVTFNHDCLIETMAAMFEVDNMLGYCLPREKRFSVHPENALNMAGPTGRADEFAAVDFLKLHGSMNWLKCTACDGIGVGSEGDFYMGSHLCGKCKKTNSLLPLVVPPNRKKDLSGLKHIWDRAYEHLTRAAAVSFIGYSLPEYDIEAQELFKRAFKDASGLRAVRVINKRYDENLKQRYVNLWKDKDLSFVDFVEMGFKETFDHAYW